LLCNTGARLSEVANLHLDDVDLSLDTVRLHGKGAKDRRARLGPKNARAVSRYLCARGSHRGIGLPDLWLAVRGTQPLSANGVKLMLKRRGLRAGISNVHATGGGTASSRVDFTVQRIADIGSPRTSGSTSAAGPAEVLYATDAGRRLPAGGGTCAPCPRAAAAAWRRLMRQG
jgi:hypothetical protein